MPDNSTKIADLEAILDAGATAGNVDGQQVSFASHDQIRRRINELKAADDDLASTARSTFNTIDLSGGTA